MSGPGVWDAMGCVVPRRLRPAHFGDKVVKGAALIDADDPLEMYRRLISQWADPNAVLGQRP